MLKTLKYAFMSPKHLLQLGMINIQLHKLMSSGS